MRDVCHVRGLGSSRTLKQNVFSLILLTPFVKLTNQKRSICRHRILYPFRLEPRSPMMSNPKTQGWFRAQLDVKLT